MVAKNIQQASAEGDAFDQGLNDRFAQLVASTTQSEIARRTGVSPQNINHYLKGVRIPASFCAKLVGALGVNPAWLLTGEGSRMLSDVSADTSAMAGDLLDLVKAMEAVTKKKLGSLAGNKQLMALRELNDTLISFESLQTKLNAHSEPVFRNIIEEMKNAIAKMDLDRLDSLARSGEQVNRLCHDVVLQREFKTCLAQRALFRREGDRTRQLYRDVVFSHVASGEEITPEACGHIYQFIITLRGELRLKEASRVCDAFIDLLRDHGETWEQYHQLVTLGGWLDVERGELGTGLPKLVAAHSRTPVAGRAANTSLMLCHGMFFAGAMTYEDVERTELFEPIGSQSRAAYALWTVDKKQLKSFAGTRDQQKGAFAFAGAMVLLFAELTLEALNGPSKNWLLQAERRCAQAWEKESNRLPREQYMTPIAIGQLARLCGAMDKARTYVIAAQEFIDQVEPERTPPLLYRALHYRNVLHVFKGSKSSREKELLTRAREFFVTHVEKGYGLFRGVVEAAMKP
ncbi:MAG: helix-turn-helix transcriptional regulator [Planctomycetes bacterium]|nr:helix-turn-helix transcriptional regulator [Planctomycetota bacterium]NUQ34963.1 helix-turn-helix transcriptional regulator [Planctomycetaceae bacterium]